MLLIQYSPSGVGMVFQFSYAAVQLLGLTMLLPMLVHWSARAIRPAMDRVGGSEGALAVDAMIQSPRRSAATVGALMVGLMFVYSTGGLHPELQAHDQPLDAPDAECGPDGGDLDAAAVDVVSLQRGPGQADRRAAGGEACARMCGSRWFRITAIRRRSARSRWTTFLSRSDECDSEREQEDGWRRCCRAARACWCQRTLRRAGD